MSAAEPTVREVALADRFGLTLLEARVLSALAEAHPRFRARKQLMNILYGDREDRPKPKILHVVICRIRKKTGLEIRNWRGAGYALTAPLQEVMAASVSDGNAPARSALEQSAGGRADG